MFNCFLDHFIAVYLWSLNHKQLFNRFPSTDCEVGCVPWTVRKAEDILITFTYEKMAHPATCGSYSDICPCLCSYCILYSWSSSHVHILPASVMRSVIIFGLCCCVMNRWPHCTLKNVCSWKKTYLEGVKTIDPQNYCRSTTGQLRDSGKGLFCGALFYNR